MKTRALTLCLVVIAAMLTQSANAADTSDLIAQGRALYFGTQAFSQAAKVAGAAMPSSATACVSCHGALGKGSREGAQAAPDITRPALSHHSAWLDAAIKGLGKQGRMLNANMPRYTLSDQEQAALSAYWPLLGSADDAVRGVTTDTITIGVLADKEQNTSAHNSILLGVQEVFERINKQGGVHGRQLRIRSLSDLNEATLKNADVFALLASTINDTASINQALKAHRLPNLAALGLSRDSEAAQSWSLALLPSLKEQAQLLLTSLSSKAREHNCTAWLFDSALLVDEAQASSLNVRRFTQALDAIDALNKEKPSRICLGLIASAERSAALISALGSENTQTPLIATLASMGKAHAFDAAEQLLILPAPTAIANHAFAAQQSVWQSMGEAAGITFIEALARSGRVLQPELVLEKMRELTGFSPIEGAPLAWSRTHSQGWSPVLLEDESRVAAAHTQVSQGEKK